MDAKLRRRLEQSGYERPGFAAHYDRYRPRPPAALLDLVPPTAGVERPRLVVDLGSGTGLSTRFWADRADEVVGIEPNDAMREWAEQATSAANVRYVGASSYETGLPDACADLVTAAQSLHSVERGDGERLVGVALSEGSMRTLLEAGVDEDEVGLDRLRAAAAELREPVPWWIAYRVWIGLK